MFVGAVMRNNNIREMEVTKTRVVDTLLSSNNHSKILQKTLYL